MIERMARRQVLVQLDDAQVAALDRLAVASDDSRSELIRRAIDRYVEAVAEAVADIRYAEAYERVPEDLEESAGLRAIAAEVWPEG
jgi:predicted transcriptional regulator